MKYCKKEEFEQNICIKDNEIIKVQWLNNINKLSLIKCRNPKILKYENENIGIFTGDQPILMGFFQAVNYYILDENGKSSIIQFKKISQMTGNGMGAGGSGNYATSTTGSNSYNFDDGDILLIKNSSDVEFIFNIGKNFGDTELYDIQNSKAYLNKTMLFFNNQIFTNIRGSLFNLKDSNYFVYAGLSTTYQSNWNYTLPSSYTTEFALFKMSLDSIESFKSFSICSKVSEKITAYGKMVSCFQTENKIIVCFYISSLTDKSYRIIIFNEDFEISEKDFGISVGYMEENIFFKCVHYEDEIGAFVYFDNTNAVNAYPIVFFAEVNSPIIEYKSNYKFNKYQSEYNTNLNLNDFMKISKEEICFTSMSENRETLYIIILNIFNDDTSQIRYYKIEAFGLYNYKFFMDLRTELYKDYIALTSSFCETSNCDSLDNSYNSLIIFNYPKGTDVNKDITEVFSEKKVISFEDLNFSLDLKDYAIIENNIFGYIYSKITIKSFQNCENIKFYSSTKLTEINTVYDLMEDEIINIVFTSSNYNSFNCTIEYVFEIQESDYDKNLEYTDTNDTQDPSGEIRDSFNNKRKTFSTSSIYYSFYLKNALTTECYENCSLCYDNSEKECILYRYEYEAATEKPTEQIEEQTVEITEKNENPKTQELTEAIIPTEKPTQIPTEKLTDKQTEISPTDSLPESKTEKLTNIQTEIKESTDLKTDSPTNRNTDLHTSQHTELPTTFETSTQALKDITDSQTNEHTDKITDIQTNAQTDMKTESKTDMPTDKQTNEITESQTNSDSQELTTRISYSDLQTDTQTNNMEFTRDTQSNIQIDNTTIIPTDIITNKDDVTYKPTDIMTNKDDISNISTNIETNKDDITNKPTDIITNKNDFTNIPTDIITHRSDISNKPTEIITSQKTDFLNDETIIGPTNLKSDIHIENKTNKITELIEEDINKKNCTNEEIIASKCKYATVSEKQFESLHEQVRKEILNNETYHKENRIIITDNIAFQITTLDNQGSNEYSNLSSVDLGECEQTLMKKCSVPEGESLIIYKTDIKSDNLMTTYVLYEIYHPITLEKLDLKLCLEDTISITVPVNLNNETLNLIQSLNNSGYNIFNTSDSFYNDICTPYTTINGTDINLNDRQHIIEDTGGSLDLCQTGCELIYFNASNQKVICDCDLQSSTSINNIDEIKFTSNLVENLFIGLKYSNYLVLQCYKLLLNFQNLKLNYGFIIMAVIIVALIVLLFIYLIKGRKKIEYYLESILKNKLVYVNNKKSMKKSICNDKSNSKLNEIDISEHDKNKKEKIKEKNKEKHKEKDKKNKDISKSKKEKKKLNKNKKKKEEKNNSSPPIKKKEIKTNTKKMKLIDNGHKILGNSISTQNLSKTSGLLAKNDIKNLNINIIPINHLNYKKSKKKKVIKAKIVNKISSKTNLKKGIDIFDLKEKKSSQKNLSLRKTSKNKKILNTDFVNYKTLNICELNNLTYKEALLIDKRSYLQYYIDLIRKKQLIFFTFVPIDDYNLISLKIALFILSFSTYIAVNIFFFSDYTMHKIYTDNGYSDFVVHLPQIIYSSIISAIIDTILKLLCLSENKILSIKEIKKINVAYKRINVTKTYLRLKFVAFFFVGFLISIFYCYFMSCYCAVYQNTQIILLKDTLLSYGLSMLYPFGLCLIPGVFRIVALRAVNKDKICLYKFSQLISFV